MFLSNNATVGFAVCFEIGIITHCIIGLHAFVVVRKRTTLEVVVIVVLTITVESILGFKCCCVQVRWI